MRFNPWDRITQSNNFIFLSLTFNVFEIHFLFQYLLFIALTISGVFNRISKKRDFMINGHTYEKCSKIFLYFFHKMWMGKGNIKWENDKKRRERGKIGLSLSGNVSYSIFCFPLSLSLPLFIVLSNSPSCYLVFFSTRRRRQSLIFSSFVSLEPIKISNAQNGKK